MSNKYTYSVPFTAEELHHDYVNLGMTQDEIGEKWGVSQKVVWHAMKKIGLKARTAAKRNQKGEANDSWKGGRTLQAKSTGDTRFSSAGYWYVRMPDHPNATKSGYIAEHIKVATESIGRPLEKGECVHHKDMNKHNNHPENLAVCTRKLHRDYHLQLELIAVQLYRAGLVDWTEEGYSMSSRLEELAREHD